VVLISVHVRKVADVAAAERERESMVAWVPAAANAQEEEGGRLVTLYSHHERGEIVGVLLTQGGRKSIRLVGNLAGREVGSGCD